MHLQRKDEFGILGRHLDAMAAGLGEREVIRSMFGRFVSEAVAQRVLAPEEAPHSVARNGSSPWSSPICPATRP